MKFYVASSLNNAEQVRIVARMLRNAGHEQTYDWTVHGSVQSEPDRWPTVAGKELDGVTDADVVVVLLPGGRGTHTELGAALAACKRVFIWGATADAMLDESGRTCVFYHQPMASLHTGSIIGMLAEVDAWEAIAMEAGL